MRIYKEEIREERLSIVKGIINIIPKAVGGVLLAVLEILFRFTPVFWIAVAIDEDITFTDFIFLDTFQSIGCDVREIKRANRRIKALKKEEQEQIITEQEGKVSINHKLKNEVLEKIKVLIETCNSLPANVQKELITKLKEVLKDYTIKYKELLNSENVKDAGISSLNESTKEKLAVIEEAIIKLLSAQQQLTDLSQEEQELLTFITAREKKQQSKSLRKTTKKDV